MNILRIFSVPFLLNSLFILRLFAGQAPATDDPIAYWPFNGNANDESGHGHNGTVYGAILTEDRFGNPASAYLFDGGTDHIGYPALWSSSPSRVTITAWFNTEYVPEYRTVIYHGDNAEFQIKLRQNELIVHFHLRNGIWYQTTSSIETDRWYFVAGVWERGGEVRLYLDGVLMDSVSVPDLPLLDAGSNYEPSIGSYAGSGTGFSGKLDDLRVYERVLSDEEILDLYNEPPADPLAQFGVCYGSTGSSEPNNPGALISIDPLTGAGTLIGPTGIIGDDGPSVRALAVKSSGEMYALSYKASSDLYSVNASTGAGTFVANTGLLHPGAMSFDADDILYAVDETNILYTVDEVTGVRTLIGATGATLGGLAYDPTDGTMYGSDNSDGIYTVDLSTGAATLVGTTGLGGNTPDIHFDQAGNLYGVKRGANGISDLIAIDKMTGAGTTIGPTGFVAVIGLATRLEAPPAIPCSDISKFQARCRPGGTIQARIILTNTNHTGETVEFTIDGTPYQVSVEANGRALLSIGVFGAGNHTVALTEPPGCYDPLSVRCSGESLQPGDDFWQNDASWETPSATVLFDNYPNPFNPSTTFRYGLSEPGQVSLKIYNMIGQLVKTVVNDYQTEGYHEVKWDGRNDVGGVVASGIYVYRLVAGSFVETKRLVFMK